MADDHPVFEPNPEEPNDVEAAALQAWLHLRDQAETKVAELLGVEAARQYTGEFVYPGDRLDQSGFIVAEIFQGTAVAVVFLNSQHLRQLQTWLNKTQGPKLWVPGKDN